MATPGIPLAYAEVTADGNVLHVCQVYTATDDQPPANLADIAEPAAARSRTVLEVPAGQDVTAGAFRVQDGEFVPIPPDAA